MGKEDGAVDKLLLSPTTLEDAPSLDLVVISDDTDPIKVVLTPLLIFSRLTLIFEVSVALSIPTDEEELLEQK